MIEQDLIPRFINPYIYTLNSGGVGLLQPLFHKEQLRYSSMFTLENYHKVSNIRRTLVGSKIVDHSDVVGASPVGAAPTASSFST